MRGRPLRGQGGPGCGAAMAEDVDADVDRLLRDVESTIVPGTAGSRLEDQDEFDEFMQNALKVRVVGKREEWEKGGVWGAVGGRADNFSGWGGYRRRGYRTSCFMHLASVYLNRSGARRKRLWTKI